MRIAIDYRVLSTEAADRGMGRHTQLQLREVLKLDTQNEYLLICRPDIQSSLILPEIRQAPNVEISVLFLPSFSGGRNPDEPEYVLRYAAEFQQHLYEKDVDLFHATSPFWPNVLASLDVCPMVATLYDLIPLVFPRQYLLPPESFTHKTYMRALHFIQEAERLIAISGSAKEDAYHFLGYPGDRVDLAYPIVSDAFRVLSEDEASDVLLDLRKRIDLPGEFLLSVTGIHHSKNVKVLLEAYKRLPPSLKRTLPLVIVLPTETVYNAFVGKYNPPRGVILTHAVSDRVLAGLYSAATLVVHPSRYEGFGYPVAEAMACGTPVVTTTSSSLPEVSGNAALLVDPDDVQGLADAIGEVVGSRKRREEMRQLGLVQVERFSGLQLGENTLGSYRQAFETSVRKDVSERPRIAIWSSFPPLRCGVADYTAELVEPLAASCETELFVDDGYLPSSRPLSRYRIHHYTAFERRDEQRPFDVVLYQMGATSFQFYMYEAIRKRPGIVVIHDLVMGLGFYFLHSQHLETLRRELLSPEGQDVVREFDRIVRLREALRQKALEHLFEEHYILQWIMDCSLAQIVHMQSSKLDLERRYGNAKVHAVHMGVADPWYGRSLRNPSVIRSKYGLNRSAFVIGIFGIVDPVKRIETCLRAMALLVRSHPESFLIVAGRHHDANYVAGLRSMIEELDISHHVCLVDYLPRDDFDDLLLASDVVVNLRDPSRKGMSAVLLRAIAAGKPVIISDIPDWKELPEGFCMRLPPDNREVSMLAEYLQGLADHPERRRQLSESARAYFEREGTLWHMAEEYLKVIQDVVARRAGMESRRQVGKE